MIGLGLTTVIAVGLLLLSQRSTPDTMPQLSDASSMMTSQETSIANPSVTGQSSVADVMYVDVKGAVKQPGIKKVDQTMRVIDAVHLAGGFTSLADEKQINLAQRLTDSQVIYIPKRGEKVPAVAADQGASTNGADPQQSEQININTADVTALQQLDGVGEKKAEKIIEYRQTQGQFQSVEDLQKVSGFGEKTLERLKPHITV